MISESGLERPELSEILKLMGSNDSSKEIFPLDFSLSKDSYKNQHSIRKLKRDI